MKYVAFYLPQFYPFPENDSWWGKGFTEWTNVTKAQPLFAGHYQPHLPTDLGFYDLRVRETQREQIALATAYGVDAFCFHYYWFGGKRLLDRPVDEFLADKGASIQFCLCYANENWTRRWDAAEHEVLIEQDYYDGWEEDFCESILPFVKDERYLNINGRPLLIVYRPQHFPDAKQSAARMRRYFARTIGVEIYLCSALIRGNWDYRQFDFDAGVEFPPHNLQVQNLRGSVETTSFFEGHIFAYEDVARQYLQRSYLDDQVFRTVFPSWDNTSRVGNRALLVIDSSPDNFQQWLGHATFLTAQERTGEEQLVFLNAWNEWAEGCHLEPDRKHGRAYLEAVERAKQRPMPTAVFQNSLSPVQPADDVSSISPHTFRPIGAWLRAVLSRSPWTLSLARTIYHALRRVRRLWMGR
jgi:lipopolysaccharide biosynthesis protein